MRPLALSFEHFGPYRQRQDIDFSVLDDFFLIYGKTGSGKTTIFDAIAYALYGEAVGGRSNLERELVSRFSPAGSKPWVEFEFVASSARWKVYRSLPYRKQNRKGKESEAAGEVSLYRMNDLAEYELLVDRPAAANQILLDLLRLRADEFSKIVLLPQGEFQQFLEMKTTERVEILEKLFDVSIYDEVTEIARRKVVQLDASLRARREELERITNELGAEPSVRTADLERSLGELDARIEKMAQEASLLEAEIAQKNERLTFWQSLVAAWRAFSEIELSKPTFEERARRLEAAKALSALEPLARQVEMQRDELEAALEKALQTGRELAKLESERSAVEAAQQNLPQLKEAQADLHRRAVLFQKALEAWRQKAELERQRLGELQRLKAAAEQCVRQEQTLAGLKNDIAELERIVAEEPGVQEELQKNLMAGEVLKRVEALFEQKERLEAQRSEILRKIQSTESLMLSSEHDLAVAEENRSRIDAELYRAQAGLLAVSLVPGEPCPVCGSREHPRPAGLLESVPNEEDIKKARDAVETIRASRAALLQNKENLENRLQEFAQELASVTQKISGEWRACAETFIDTASRGALVSAGARLMSQRRDVERRLKEYRDARERLQQLRRALDNAERDYARLQKEKATLDIACAELDARLLSLAEQAGSEDPGPRLQEVQTRLLSLQTEIARAEARVQEWHLASSRANTEIELHLATVTSRGNALAAGLEQFLDEAEKAKAESLLHVLHASDERAPSQEMHPQPQTGARRAARESIQTALWELGRSLPRTGHLESEANRLIDLAGSLEAVFSAHPSGEAGAFDLVQNILCAGWPQARVREEERALSAFRDSYAKLRTSYEVLAARVQVSSSLELEQEARALVEACAALAERKRALETSVSELHSERARLGAELERLRQLHSRAEALKNEYASATEEFGREEKLARLLSGSLNPQRKMPFKNYVLGLQFREIAARASERLYRMSSGRYIVEADILSGSGNQKIGLELFVTDAWNGARRPVGTLSGGEKFMLAISLALGLADSIQERAGAQRIESLFIDEGFGSLDAESLSLAISVLEELRGDKTIAIVSHVEELCSRIPSRIVVRKGVRGSHLEIERD